MPCLSVHDFCLVLARFENATAVAVVTPMIILGVPITDTFLAIIRGPCLVKNFINRIALTCTTDLPLGLTHRRQPLCGLWNFDDFLFDFSLAQHSESHWGVCDRALVWSRVVSRIDWDSGATSSPLLNVLRYIEFFLSGGSSSKTKRKN